MIALSKMVSLASLAGLLACTSTSYADPPAASGGAGGGGDFRFQKVVAAGTKVEVRSMNGPITFEPANGDTLEVVAVKSGRTADFGRVQIISREEGGALIFCALWPGQDASSCRGDRGKLHDDTEVKVDFKLRVPAKVAAVLAETMNGPIRAHDVHGDATLHTMNGLVEVDATGTIVAETMNGEVKARAAAGKDVRAKTANGAISVALPAGAGADVDAATTHGRISSEFGDVPPPTMPALHAARFTIGAGGAAVSLHTTNGNVVLKKL